MYQQGCYEVMKFSGRKFSLFLNTMIYTLQCESGSSKMSLQMLIPNLIYKSTTLSRIFPGYLNHLWTRMFLWLFAVTFFLKNFEWGIPIFILLGGVWSSRLVSDYQLPRPRYLKGWLMMVCSAARRGLVVNFAR